MIGEGGGVRERGSVMFLCLLESDCFARASGEGLYPDLSFSRNVRTMKLCLAACRGQPCLFISNSYDTLFKQYKNVKHAAHGPLHKVYDVYWHGVQKCKNLQRLSKTKKINISFTGLRLFSLSYTRDQ